MYKPKLEINVIFQFVHLFLFISFSGIDRQDEKGKYCLQILDLIVAFCYNLYKTVTICY